MFEQEASEYAKPFHDMTRYDYVEERTHVREAFQKGAEFGYNHALNEQGYKVESAYREGVAVGRDKAKSEEWHDLRKDPNDLPTKVTPLVSITVLNQFGNYCWYSYKDKQWEDGNPRTDGTYDCEIIAWCHVPIWQGDK